MKITLLFLVLVLLVGCQASVETVVEENTEEVNTEDPSDELYDGLGDALLELDELEEEV
jgi:uncharacterized protein YcfL